MSWWHEFQHVENWSLERQDHSTGRAIETVNAFKYTESHKNSSYISPFRYLMRPSLLLSSEWCALRNQLAIFI